MSKASAAAAAAEVAEVRGACEQEFFRERVCHTIRLSPLGVGSCELKTDDDCWTRF